MITLSETEIRDMDKPTTVADLHEASLQVSRAILDDGSMSVQGEWANVMDEAADRIKELEARLKAMKPYLIHYTQCPRFGILGNTSLEVKCTCRLQALLEISDE